MPGRGTKLAPLQGGAESRPPEPSPSRAGVGRRVAQSMRPAPPPPTAEQQLFRRDLLRWLYLGRLTLVAGILAGALFAWFDARPEDTLLATLMFLAALIFSMGSYWHTHIESREPTENFLYAQVVLDTLLVTGIVHVTGGPESSFASVYILVISSGALLLPLPGGVLPSRASCTSRTSPGGMRARSPSRLRSGSDSSPSWR